MAFQVSSLWWAILNGIMAGSECSRETQAIILAICLDKNVVTSDILLLIVERQCIVRPFKTSYWTNRRRKSARVDGDMIGVEVGTRWRATG